MIKQKVGAPKSVQMIDFITILAYFPGRNSKSIFRLLFYPSKKQDGEGKSILDCMTNPREREKDRGGTRYKGKQLKYLVHVILFFIIRDFQMDFNYFKRAFFN